MISVFLCYFFQSKFLLIDVLVGVPLEWGNLRVDVEKRGQCSTQGWQRGELLPLPKGGKAGHGYQNWGSVAVGEGWLSDRSCGLQQREGTNARQSPSPCPSLAPTFRCIPLDKSNQKPQAKRPALGVQGGTQTQGAYGNVQHKVKRWDFFFFQGF